MRLLPSRLMIVGPDPFQSLALGVGHSFAHFCSPPSFGRFDPLLIRFPVASDTMGVGQFLSPCCTAT